MWFRDLVMNNDVISALNIAKICHTGQTRQNGDPYYVHPFVVTRILEHYCVTTLEMLQAAALHDVIEDTSMTLGQVRKVFGVHVCGLVAQLTDIPQEGMRRCRKKVDAARIAYACHMVHEIKCADIIHNVYGAMDFGSEFSQTFLKEKAFTIKLINTCIATTSPIIDLAESFIKYRLRGESTDMALFDLIKNIEIWEQEAKTLCE